MARIAVVLVVCATACASAAEPPPGTPPSTEPARVASAEPGYPTKHPRIYLGPNRLRLVAALGKRTPEARRFRGMVDRWVRGENLWGFPTWNAALIGALTGEAKYCSKAVTTIEAQVAAAEAKIAAGARPEVADDSYLQVGDLLGDLALVYDWCHAAVKPAQRTRWIDYANATLYNVWNHDQAKWGTQPAAWTGWSVDNPSNNYYYSFLRATMLVGLATQDESPQAPAWLTKFRTKITDQLIPTFDSDLVGGASREGTGYGVAMRRLFELYDLWQATTGEPLGARTKHTRDSMLAFIHQVVPTLDRVAPTGDHSRDSTAALFDYHRNYLQVLIALMPSDPLAARAKALLAASSVPAMASEFMFAYDFLYDNASVAARPLVGLDTAYYARGIGELYARSDWTKGATWVNLIAGPYTESHAHQDQGSILIYKGGWLAYDPVIHSRSGLPQTTTMHSIVRIDRDGAPIKQVPSTISKLEALHRGDGYVYAAADLTPAYNGDQGVLKVQREIVYLPPDDVVVFDRVHTAAGTTQTWQLAVPVKPAIDASGAAAVIGNAGHRLTVARVGGGAALSAYDFRASEDSGKGDLSGGFRLDERVAGGDVRYLHALCIDRPGTAVAVGPTGVTIKLAKTTATVTFDRDAIGATLVLAGKTIGLAPGVDNWPNCMRRIARPAKRCA